MDDELFRRLKALGIQVGVKTPSQHSKLSYDQATSVLGGTLKENNHGVVLKIVSHLEFPPFHDNPIPNILIGSTNNSQISSNIYPSELLILDIETTGSLGSGGAACFLIGIGRIGQANFELTQLVLLHPQDEFAQLLELEGEVAKAKGIVSYNGKSFDIPILTNRFRFHHLVPPFNDTFHLDLLHLSRRIWKDRLPNRALRTIEAHILDIEREVNDIPGWIIPQLYQEYLRTQDYYQLVPILYHNKMDVISLANLFMYLSQMFHNPLAFEFEDISDRLAVAKFFFIQGEIEKAKEQFNYCLSQNPSKSEHINVLESLGNIQKISGNIKEAVDYWRLAAKMGSISSHIELAKYYEHKQKNPETAIMWTENAIKLLNTKQFNRIDKFRYEPELKYRLARLIKKTESRNS